MPEIRVARPFLELLQKSVLLILLQNYEKIGAK